MEESKLYVLEEMNESIESAINNAREVVAKQMDLVDVLRTSSKAAQFEELIKSVDEQINDITNQIDRLTQQNAALVDVIAACRTDSNIEQFATRMLTALNAKM